jgi:hypothetical protein
MQSNVRKYQPIRAPYFGAELTHFERQLPALTPNATTRYLIFTPTVKGSVDVTKLRLSLQGLPVTPGTLFVRVRKYDASANTFVTLTDDMDLEATPIANESVGFVPISTWGDPHVYCDTGDTLVAEVTSNNATISPQPVDLAVSGLYFNQDP